MNSHIWNWSPSFRVAIDWRPKGIDRQPEAKKKGHAPREHSYRHTVQSYYRVAVPQPLVVFLIRDWCRLWDLKKKGQITLRRLQLCWKSDSLVKPAIRWDQSPRNWHRRPNKFSTSPRGYSIFPGLDTMIVEWLHGDVTISITYDFPLHKTIILSALE